MRPPRRWVIDVAPTILEAAIKGNERPGVDLYRDQEREFISGPGTGDSWQLLIPTLNDQEGAQRRWPLRRVLALLRAAARPEGRRGFWGRRALRYGIGSAFLGDGRHAQPFQIFGAAAVRVEAQRRTIRV